LIDLRVREHQGELEFGDRPTEHGEVDRRPGGAREPAHFDEFHRRDVDLHDQQGRYVGGSSLGNFVAPSGGGKRKSFELSNASTDGALNRWRYTGTPRTKSTSNRRFVDSPKRIESHTVFRV